METKTKLPCQMTSEELTKKIKQFIIQIDKDYPLECDLVNIMLHRFEAVCKMADTLIVENAMCHIQRLLDEPTSPEGHRIIAIVRHGKDE